MSPVHVLVSEDAADEQAWLDAFGGAVHLYRFASNAETFERLTSAEAPIDLVVITGNQGGPFNLSADQLVARVVDSTIGSIGPLAALHVLVVGDFVRSSNPRVACVSNFDAAIRLVKFGEVESAPRPTFVPTTESPSVDDELATLAGREAIDTADLDFGPDDSMFASSVISRIWDAGDQAASAAKRRLQQPVERRIEGGGASQPRGRRGAARADRLTSSAGAPPAAVQAAALRSAPASDARAHADARRVPTQLFAHAPTPAMSMAAPGGGVQGGGAAAPEHAPSIPGERVEVRSGMTLAPARTYSLPAGAGYRGPAVRGGAVHPAAHAPVPPALAQQVHSMVYPAQGAVNDPMLVWSGGGGGTVVAAIEPGLMTAMPPAPAPHVQAVLPHGQFEAAQPASASQPAPPAHLPGAHSMPSSDPLMRRAESDGGVQFG